MTYIAAIPYTTFNHATITTEISVKEHNYPTLYTLLKYRYQSMPHHPSLTLNKEFHIPPTFNRQLKILECLITPLTDEELRALAMLRGFEAYVGVIYTYHLYLIEILFNELEQ